MAKKIEEKHYVKGLRNVQLNFKISSTLDAEFRNAVFANKGMKKGVMTEAFAEAMTLWIEQNRSASINKTSTLSGTRRLRIDCKNCGHTITTYNKLTNMDYEMVKSSTLTCQHCGKAENKMI